MKKILYSFIIMALAVGVFSCEDTSTDPLQMNNVKKGTVLALRGQQLTNIYSLGIPGAEFFPRIIDGTEKFEFEAEYLAEDVSTLESFDIFVLKNVGGAFERVLLTNVPGSAFTQTADYLRPSVAVSLNLTDILDALGLSDYEDPAVVNTLLTTYKFGVNLECDLNLTDGSQVLAADIVAAGLFASNQFYPAQKLTYSVTDFCPYEATWAGTYTANEIYASSVYGPYNVTFTQDPGDPNRYNFTNFWDYGLPAYVVFTPTSDDPDGQIVEFPEQTVDGETLTGTGTYDMCLQTFKIQTSYAGSDWRYEFKKQ
jgi:hypothetical protein